MKNFDYLRGLPYCNVEKQLLSDHYVLTGKLNSRDHKTMTCYFFTRSHGHHVLKLTHDWASPDMYGVQKAGTIIAYEVEELPE